MWKILGEKTIYIDIPNTTKVSLIRLAGDSDKEMRFKELMGMSEIMFLINGETEECSFFITVPDDLTPDDIQLMADVVLDIAKNIESPFIEVDGTEQRYKIIINNAKEPELLGINKTPGMSSMEVFKPIIKSLDSRGKPNSEFYR